MSAILTERDRLRGSIIKKSVLLYIMKQEKKHWIDKQGIEHTRHWNLSDFARDLEASPRTMFRWFQSGRIRSYYKRELRKRGIEIPDDSSI